MNASLTVNQTILTFMHVCLLHTCYPNTTSIQREKDRERGREAQFCNYYVI